MHKSFFPELQLSENVLSGLRVIRGIIKHASHSVSINKAPVQERGGSLSRMMDKVESAEGGTHSRLIHRNVKRFQSSSDDYLQANERAAQRNIKGSVLAKMRKSIKFFREQESTTPGNMLIIKDFLRAASFETCLGVFRSLVWMISVIVCCYFMILQLEDCIDKLSNPPIAMQTKVHILDAMDYPAVTFCFKNRDEQGYDLDILKYHNISDYWILFNTGNYRNLPWRNFDFTSVNVTKVWEDASYHQKLLVPTRDESHEQTSNTMPPKSIVAIVTSKLNNVPGSANGLIMSKRYYHDHGLCTTFRPPTDREKPPPGQMNGYKFTFLLLTTSARMIPGAWDVFIHEVGENWAENPMLSYRGEHLHIKSGREVYVKLSASIFRSLNVPDYPCDPHADGSSFTQCMEICRWKLVAEHPDIQCIMPFMPLPGYNMCDTHDAAIRAMELYRYWTGTESKEKCESKCLKPCTVTMYNTQVTRDKVLTEHGIYENRFHIYFPSGVVQDLTEEWAYDTTLFIADVGGSLGFLLGVSILSVVEILEGLAIATYRVYVDHRQRMANNAAKSARRRNGFLEHSDSISKTKS